MSLRPVSTSARRTRRPMRPNPLIATRTAMGLFLLLKPRQRGIGGGFRGDSEMLVQILRRRAGAKTAHADEGAIGTGIMLPTHRACGLDRDAHRAGAER